MKIKFSITLLVAFILFSCSNKEGKLKGVFRYNESKGISTLDPAFAKSQTIIWPVSQIFNGLVQMDRNTSIQPCIASDWEISNDGRTYIFNLRNDVVFHKSSVFEKGTRKVVAHDFVYSLKRLFDAKTASPGAWVMNYLDKDTLDNGLLAQNDSVLVIQLKQAFPGFLGILTMAYCSVVPEEVVEYYGKNFRNHPIGTGPFYMKKWREGEKLVLRKNNNYFEKDDVGNPLPKLEAIAISFVSDKQSEFLEFSKGNIDFISGVHNSYKDELLSRSGNLQTKYQDQINISKAPYLNTEYLGFLVKSEMGTVSNKYLRKAINFGFDRVKMLSYLRNNIGTAAQQGFIPKGLLAFDEDRKGYVYNKDSALYYLDLAGFPKGKNIPEITLTTTSDYVDLCEYIQHELSDLGFKIAIDISSGATFRDQVATSKLDFFRGSWIADYPDAENYLSLFYSKNFSPNGPNYTHFENLEYDNLYESSLKEVNDSIRRVLYGKMDMILIEEAPVVPLFYDEIIRFSRKNVRNFETNAMNMLFLKDVYKESKNL
jgi:peptide/nickel transport system substrate-binding protein